MNEIITLIVGLVLGYILRTRGDENQIRYMRLYEKRAEVLASLSERAYKLHKELELWTSPFQFGGEEEMKKKRTTVAGNFNEFADCYYSNSLWLDEQTMNNVEALLSQIREVINKYDKIPGTGFEHPQQVRKHLEIETDWVTDWDDIHRQATIDVKETKAEIDREFKAILGVSDLLRKPKTTLEIQVRTLVVTLISKAKSLLNRNESNR